MFHYLDSSIITNAAANSMLSPPDEVTLDLNKIANENKSKEILFDSNLQAADKNNGELPFERPKRRMKRDVTSYYPYEIEDSNEELEYPHMPNSYSYGEYYPVPSPQLDYSDESSSEEYNLPNYQRVPGQFEVEMVKPLPTNKRFYRSYYGRPKKRNWVCQIKIDFLFLT